MYKNYTENLSEGFEYQESVDSGQETAWPNHQTELKY